MTPMFNRVNKNCCPEAFYSKNVIKKFGKTLMHEVKVSRWIHCFPEFDTVISKRKWRYSLNNAFFPSTTKDSKCKLFSHQFTMSQKKKEKFGNKWFQKSLLVWLIETVIPSHLLIQRNFQPCWYCSYIELLKDIKKRLGNSLFTKNYKN